MNLLGTWRRFHGYQVIAEARPSEDAQMWTSFAARVDTPIIDDAVGRAFSLRADAQADADELARVLWPHECGAMCGNWRCI